MGRGLQEECPYDNYSCDASGLVMWPEASHFALRVLLKLGPWIWNKVFRRRRKQRPTYRVRARRERTFEVKVTDEFLIESDGIVFGPICDTPNDDIKQMLKSLPEWE